MSDLLYDIPPEIYPVFGRLTLWHSPWDLSSLWQTYYMTSPLRSKQSLADLLYDIPPEIYPVFGRLTLWHSPWDLSSLWQAYFMTLPLRSIQSLADLLYDIPPEIYPVFGRLTLWHSPWDLSSSKRKFSISSANSSALTWASANASFKMCFCVSNCTTQSFSS